MMCWDMDGWICLNQLDWTGWDGTTFLGRSGSHLLCFASLCHIFAFVYTEVWLEQLYRDDDG